MRHYWHPVALLDEFDPRFDPRMEKRPVKAVRLLGQDLVLFRDGANQWGLLDRDCPHRGADLAFGRRETDGLRCPFHGWKFDTKGNCLETPAEPKGSTLCSRVKQRSYPVVEKAGVLFAFLGPEGSTPPEFPEFDCFTAPSSYVFAFKGLWRCNWLQAFEVGIDPAHASFLHRFFEDESLDASYGKQFRGASSGDLEGEKWPITRVLREFDCPEISFEPTEFGMRITALRQLNERSTHVRVTNGPPPTMTSLCITRTVARPRGVARTLRSVAADARGTGPTGGVSRRISRRCRKCRCSRDRNWRRAQDRTAAAAGLPCDGGILVDETLKTADPSISAIGDCAAFMYEPWSRRTRIESVYNAYAQAKVVSQRLAARAEPYRPIPWFWSDQGQLRLQIAGMWRPGLRAEVLASTPESFAVYHRDEGGGLVASECIGAPRIHISAHRTLEEGGASFDDVHRQPIGAVAPD